MSEGTRKRRDFIQNITIVLLSLSAVFLFTQTQVNSLGIGPLSFLADSNLPAGGSGFKSLRAVWQRYPDHGQRRV